MSLLAKLRERYKVQVNPLRAERRVELLVLGLVLLLLLQLAYSIFQLATIARPEPILPAIDSTGEGGALWVEGVTEAASQEVRARPLFWTSRRPYSPEPEETLVEEAPAETGELKEIKLVGIFGAGDSAGIITLVQGKKQRILLGEEIGGWKLDAIEQDQAEFSSGGRTRKLTMKPATFQNKKPAPQQGEKK
jgi:hypothetical protein